MISQVPKHNEAHMCLQHTTNMKYMCVYRCLPPAHAHAHARAHTHARTRTRTCTCAHAHTHAHAHAGRAALHPAVVRRLLHGGRNRWRRDDSSWRVVLTRRAVHRRPQHAGAGTWEGLECGGYPGVKGFGALGALEGCVGRA
eukprot:362607-Chlamydomonas_euryale.AAC.26